MALLDPRLAILDETDSGLDIDALKFVSQCANQFAKKNNAIGCYFDDPVHAAFGIVSREWQSFYHFTLGSPVEDSRLTTLPTYNFKEQQ
jgi:hypothetical protein